MADLKALVEETKEDAQYDETARKLLAQKPFLANILVRTVKEFMGMDPAEVEKLIEGEPFVHEISAEPGFTNDSLSGEPREITGMDSADKVRGENVVYFDVVFFVRTPDGLSKVIINIEAQKSEPTEYDVEMRGIYYAVREVSSQLDREFKHQQYNDIKKVYSIWICMNEPENTLEKIYLTKEDLIGHSRWKDMYEVINVVIVRLGKNLDPEADHGLHRLLGALFLPEMPAEEKTGMLENEFGIEMEGERKEMLNTMCNLSQGIKEQGIKLGTEQGILLGKEQGIKLGTEQGIRLGTEQGIQQGRASEIFSSVQDGDYGPERGAQKMGLSLPEFERRMAEAGYRVPAGV